MPGVSRSFRSRADSVTSLPEEKYFADDYWTIMPESIRTYVNRCRACLERFFDNEKISPLTSFIISQFQSFTNLTLQESDLLSPHLCEFCHQELLRFSVFKKDLIEKQQKLNELLRSHDEKMYQRTHRGLGSHVKIEEESELESSSGEEEAFTEASEIEDYEEEEVEAAPVPEVDEPEESNFSEPDDKNDEDFSIKSFSIKNFKSRPKKPEPTKSIIPLAVGKFVCDYCTATFKAKQGLTRHVQSHIANSVPWKCDIERCHFAGSSRIKLSLHKFEAHNIPVSAGRSSEQIKKPKLEVIVEVNEEVKDFICFCGLKFKSMYSLRAHKNRLHRSLNKCVYGCKNLQYVKSGQFLRHVQQKHPEHYADCLKRASAIVSPLKTNGNIKFKIFHCERCDYKTLKQADLKAHSEVHHEKKFKCFTCGKRYSKSFLLTRHKLTCRKKSTKVVTSPIVRQKASKFAVKMLQMREETPGAESRHVCETPGCTMAFSKRFNLMRHQKAKGHLSADELKKLKYKCICGERFFSASGHAYHRDKMKCLKKNPIYED